MDAETNFNLGLALGLGLMGLSWWVSARSRWATWLYIASVQDVEKFPDGKFYRFIPEDYKYIRPPDQEQLPPMETPVLVLVNGEWHIGARFMDCPSFEDTYQPYWYWDDPNNEGQAWEHDAIEEWLPIPS